MTDEAGRRRIPSRERVLEALRRDGDDERAAARSLGASPGLVHLVATGRPADGGPDDDQRLVNPREHNPTRKPHVLEWVARRARRELTRSAG